MTEGSILLNEQYASITLYGSKECYEDPRDKEWKFIGIKKKRTQQENFQKDKHCQHCEAWKQTFAQLISR